jgi:diguanylate cyclase (GGDEF)-like protein/PAS domain S-box-containing protein
MPTIDFIYFAFALMIGSLYLALGIFALKHRSVPGSSALAMIMFGAAGYAVPYIFQLASPNLSAARWWYDISLPGASILGPAWFIFAWQYTQQKEVLSKRRALLLSLIPVFSCLAAWTNPLHSLYGTNFRFNPQEPWPKLEWDFGFFYWLNFAYSYFLTAVGVVILLRAAVRRFKFFTNQTILLLVGIIVPVVVNVLFVLGISPIPKMDLAPFLFLVTGITWSMAIFRYQLLDIVPIAHERVFGTMPVGMIVLNLHGQVVDINPSGLRMISFQSHEIIGKPLPLSLDTVFFDESDKLVLREFTKEACLGQGDQQQYLDLHQTPLFDNRKRPIGALLLLQDITLRKQAIDAERDQRFLAELLRDTASDMKRILKFEEVLDHILINVGKLVFHDAAHLILLNPSDQRIYCCRRLGEYAAAPRVENSSGIPHPVIECSQTFLEMMKNSPVPVLITEQDILGDCLICPGREQVLSSIAMPVHIRGQLAGMVIIDSRSPGHFTDKHIERLSMFSGQAAVAIENAWLYKELEERANRDELTGAFNRRGLLEQAQLELKRSRRFRHPIGVIMFDLDHFKQVNDTYGHDSGDIVLRTIVRQCLANIRELDILGRYGGDEFVVLLPESGRDAACLVGERLRKCVENYPINIGENRIHITMSIGITFDPDGESDFMFLLQKADRALYQAKHEGRNLTRFCP